jgi:hypothetical protein
MSGCTRCHIRLKALRLGRVCAKITVVILLRSIPVKGSYWNEATGVRVDDANSGTLACYEGAIGKCISAGYRIWATAQQCTGSGKGKKCTTVSLKDHHQACTRMMRADYCGDGKSYTVNGTVLDIFDYLQPPVQLQEEKWQMEARWTPTGASCLTERRHEEIKFPGCKGRKLKECEPYCASSDRGGDALLIRSFGRTDFQEGSAHTLYQSVMQQLFTLPDDCAVFPGHDYKGRTASTIAEEKRFNPRLGTGKTEAEFVAIMSELKLAHPRRMDVAVPANLQCGNLKPPAVDGTGLPPSR